MTINERVKAVLEGRKPDRLPFVDRIELWHRRHHGSPSVPPKYQGLDINQIHADLGLGRQKFCMPLALRLKGVELEVSHNGEPLLAESEPVYTEFPALNAPEFVPRDRAGETLIQFKTSRGTVSVTYQVSESMVEQKGAEPYLSRQLIKQDADYQVAEYILERSQPVTYFERLREDELEVGSHGFVVPRVHRHPFQQALLEYLGEVPLFYATYQNQERLQRLLSVLDEQVTEMIRLYEGVDTAMVELPDNLDGFMTNPKLFRQYCLPYYQKYADLLHAQGKKMCSHTDGNLKPILDLLPESGLDIAEAFSPAPLTDCSFAEATQAWGDKPMIWGGIPSPVLEENVPQTQFEELVGQTLQIAAEHPLILGIGDQVMPESLIERVAYIADQVEQLVL